MANRTSTSTSQLIQNAITGISTSSPDPNSNLIFLISGLEQLLQSEACDEDRPLDAETQQAVMQAIELLFGKAYGLEVHQMVRFLGAVYVLVVVCVNGLCVAEEEEEDDGGDDMDSVVEID